MSRIHLAAVPLVALLATGRVARSDDYPQRIAARVQSLTHGMQKPSVPLLNREKGDSIAAKGVLLASLCGKTCQTNTRTLPNGTSRVTTPSWVIDIRGDGTLVEATVPGAMERAHLTGVAQSSRMTQGALESSGRAFIASNLGSLIVLAPHEQLVPVTAAYRVEGGQDAMTGAMAPESVVANRVQFGRVIDGTPVVGGGSTVTITFDNDGSIESFRYDWPSYSSTQDSRLSLGPGDILNRVQSVIGLRIGSSGAGLLPTPSAYPVNLTATAQLRALECGYFDPGLANRDPSAPVQAGCVYHVVEGAAVTSVGTTGAYSGAIPAATQIEADSSWKEASLFLGTVVSGAAPPLSAPAR